MAGKMPSLTGDKGSTYYLRGNNSARARIQWFRVVLIGSKRSLGGRVAYSQRQENTVRSQTLQWDREEVCRAEGECLAQSQAIGESGKSIPCGTTRAPVAQPSRIRGPAVALRRRRHLV